MDKNIVASTQGHYDGTPAMNARGVRYLACPVLSAIIYVGLSYEHGISRSVMAYAASFLPYFWLTLSLNKRSQKELTEGQLLGSLAIAGSLLLLPDPILSEDIYRYIWDASHM